MFKWIAGVALYAMVVITGGTMQSVMSVPYQNPIKDGHELTRDLMAGVVHKTAIEDLFAGIPMFGRYANMFDFTKATSTDVMKLSASEFIPNSENKIREIGFLPALSFSAEAGEIEQVNYMPPLQMFELEAVLENRDISPYETPHKKEKTLIGVAHSKNSSYVLFGMSMFNYTGVDGIAYLDEVKGFGEYGIVRASPSNGKVGDYINANTMGLCRSFEDKTYLFRRGEPTYRFVDAVAYKTAHISASNPSSQYGNFVEFMDRTVFDMNRGVAMSQEEAEKSTIYQRAKKLYTTGADGRFGSIYSYWDSVPYGQIQRIKGYNSSAKPEDIILEFKINPFKSIAGFNREVVTTDQRVPHFESGDIRVVSINGEDRFVVSKDYRNYEDTGISAKNQIHMLRSNNFLYTEDPFAKKIYVYRLRKKGQEVYGYKPYYERGRVWQR